ncbi:MAG: retron St85 family RNA-directed DNA polymerase [Proteobacteria bacterium]|nr:retron St85 family RNA-directed DNA polymerase [Pseudomonadota bacterium]
MNRNQLIAELAAQLRVSPANIERVIASAHRRYKRYTLIKRTGGSREIFHPTPELKAIQRWLIKNVFDQLPTHPSVHAYEPNCSIARHAAAHRRSNFFLRMDFSDFFPSISAQWVKNFLLESIQAGLVDLDKDSVDSICRLVCRRGRLEVESKLTIGSPSSPSISNRILYTFDSKLFEACHERGVIYTRYADDIYFSTREPDVLHEIEQIVTDLVRATVPELSLNRKKTQRASRKRRVLITGLVITSDRKISVGRDLKRSVRTQIHLWKQGNLPLEDIPRLRGLVSFIAGTEPEFLSSISRKYGAESIERLLNPAIN